MNNCTTCKTPVCDCSSKSKPVMPPSECNTQDCPDPNPCSEVHPVDCIVWTTEDKLCGEDIIYSAGDSLPTVIGNVVDYFCNVMGSLNYVQSVTGDGVDNTDPYNPVIDLSEYVLTSSLATVATSGNYSDLSGLPTIENWVTASLLYTGDVTHDAAGYDTVIQNAGNWSFDGGKIKIGGTGLPIAVLEVVSPSASSLDTAFAIKNNTESGNLFHVNAIGNFGFGVDAVSSIRSRIVEGGSLIGYFAATTDGVAGYFDSVNAYAVFGRSTNSYGGFFTSEFLAGINTSSNTSWGALISGSTGLGAQISGTLTTIAFSALSSYKAFNIRNSLNSLDFLSVNGVGGISMPAVQVGNAGLASGDLYFDTAANILANGDLICARKV